MGILVLAGCTEKSQPDGKSIERQADRPAVAEALKEVLDLVLPEAGASVADLERVDVDVAGTTAVVGYPANRVTAWDLVSRNQIGEILLPPDSRLRALSPDGEILAAADDNGELSLWNVPGQQHITSVRADFFDVGFFDVGFSSSGDRLAVGGGGITVLDTRTGEVTAQMTAADLHPLLPESELGGGAPDPVNQVYFTADDAIVASSFSYWLIWRPGTEPVVVAPDYGIRMSVLSPDRSRLLLVSDLGLFTWDIVARQQVSAAELPGGDINSIDGAIYDATGNSLIVVWQERFPVDPSYTFTRVVEHVDTFELPDMDPVRSEAVTYFTGVYVERLSGAVAASGDLVLVTVGAEHLIMQEGALTTGPGFAVCAAGMTCREGFALQRDGDRSTVMMWMYGRWRPILEGQPLTSFDLERHGLYTPYMAQLFPEANISE
ncbi:WD40 repeat domain-containing protein [Verrucosispora sp. WMMA2044]|uniref:WD40 repeat domain-containing protein n=1 Tax=Verrucosispora sp. WMMA2044 TaxID=3016419 RepID=UPI00248BB843|nr:WD40 repeat domain-containing protein [Verrucosispora sp. WMMA2044]WBB47326.1 WD40 repeat domain-containing protein [Verrucosispora sp. WMMA2044]